MNKVLKNKVITNLQKFIKGLQIIQEKELDTKFTFYQDTIALDDINLYSKEEIFQSKKLSFIINKECEYFEFIH